MDTLGTIAPQDSSCSETAQRTEALERLRYLGQTGSEGILLGAAGTGKTWLLGQVARLLRREGVAVAQLNLSGVSGAELPHQIAARLGLGLPLQTMEFEVWARLQDYAEAARTMKRRMAFLVDHVDRSKDSALMSLTRLMDQFGENCAWLLACRTPSSDRWAAFLNDRSWLRVELKELQVRESAQLLTREATKRSKPVRFTPEGITAAHELSGGTMRRLNQLIELATLAIEAEGGSEVDADLLHALAREVNFQSLPV